MNATICGAWVVVTYWKGRDAVGWQGKKVYSAFTVPPLPPQILSSPALSSDGSLGFLALAANAHFGPKAGFSRELFFRSCEATFGAAHGGMESALLPGHCLGWPWHSSSWLWCCMVSRQSNKVVQKGTGSSCARWTAGLIVALPQTTLARLLLIVEGTPLGQSSSHGSPSGLGAAHGCGAAQKASPAQGSQFPSWRGNVCVLLMVVWNLPSFQEH